MYAFHGCPMRIELAFTAFAGLALAACGSSPKFDRSDAVKSPQMNSIAATTPEGAGSQVNATVFVDSKAVPPGGGQSKSHPRR